MRGGEPRLSLHVTENDSVAASSYTGVGAMLREQRERTGESLEEASQRLRIRFPHLQAIEQGRFDDLPGRIYAIGFVRTYAEYLGLDPTATIDLYKQETAGEEHSPKLVFPTPTAESRMPKVWLVAASIVAAVVVYGGWHMTQDSGRAIVETVPPVPDQLIAQTGDAPAPPAADSASAAPAQNNRTAAAEKGPATVKPAEKPKEEPKPAVAAAEPEPEKQPAREEQVAAAPVSDDPPPQPAAAEPEAAAEAPEPPAADTTQSAEPDPPTQQTARTEAAPTDTVDESPTVETETAAAQDEEDREVEVAADNRRTNIPITRFTDPADTNPSDFVRTERQRTPEPPRQAPEDDPAEEEAQVAAVNPTPSPSRTAPPPLPPSAASPDSGDSGSDGLGANGYVPRVFGSDDSGGRVIVTATMDSWVQVRGGDNELLLTRILRAGDRYQAPDRSDLVLMTGNAGGLEIRVDGKLVPPIGPVGEVRRNVSLAAGSLLDRTSANQ